MLCVLSVESLASVWLTSVSAITGSAEPIYGPEAFRAIDETVQGKNPYGELTIDDLSWKSPSNSHVETQTFYFSAEDGYYGFVQVIHSNPIGIHFTAQFTCLIMNDSLPADEGGRLWTSTNLENFSANGSSFEADGLSIKLNDEGTVYTVTSVVNEDSLVELKFTRECLGFKIGSDGLSLYGENLNEPWGVMKHGFWPRCTVSGKLVAKGKELSIENGQGMYVMALQGMKPHHAAARWNFLNFQGPTMSAVVMEFTTPPSYGSKKSSIGCVVKDGKLLATATGVKCEHVENEVDDVGWPAPKKIRFEINGHKIDASDDDVANATDSAAVSAVVDGEIPRLFDRVDVMAEIPSFVKRVVSGVSGARPYIYQYRNKLHMKLEVDGETFEEDGYAFNEATFIS